MLNIKKIAFPNLFYDDIKPGNGCVSAKRRDRWRGETVCCWALLSGLQHLSKNLSSTDHICTITHTKPEIWEIRKFYFIKVTSFLSDSILSVVCNHFSECLLMLMNLRNLDVYFHGHIFIHKTQSCVCKMGIELLSILFFSDKATIKNTTIQCEHTTKCQTNVR